MGAPKYLPYHNNSRRKWFWGIYIYYSNGSLMFINLWGLGKYESKHKGRWNVFLSNLGQIYDQKRTDIEKVREFIKDYTI